MRIRAYNATQATGLPPIPPYPRRILPLYINECRNTGGTARIHNEMHGLAANCADSLRIARIHYELHELDVFDGPKLHSVFVRVRAYARARTNLNKLKQI